MSKSWKNIHQMYVRYEGLFDFDGLYAAIVDWSKNFGYRWHEASYKHKVPSTKGAEQEFKWILERDVDQLASFKILIEAHTWDQMEVVIESDGKQKTLTNARIEIVIKPSISLDWQKRFKGGPWKIWDKVWEIYFKLVREELELKYGDTLIYRLYGFQAMLKKFFDMQSKNNAYKRYLGDN
ncbi:hypothetical protein HN385_02740 [archaeon]|jgi:hypothetical protein|nr:hypothetical protein [archaeon]MBT3450668.1 hypothetical protein [archaeon]MBT6868752.1 hypothetical protein [archaeon]MBT7193027.1 hypothetical protein [archaeon]MBT7380993.1 hypothetical protein [archaeon]